jgi:hypothetical protein
MESDKEKTTSKNKWITPVLLVLDTRYTQSGSSVNKDSEDDVYTFTQLS